MPSDHESRLQACDGRTHFTEQPCGLPAGHVSPCRTHPQKTAVERIGDLYVGSRAEGVWRVCFAASDIIEGQPYELDNFDTEAEARAFARGYMTGATP